MKAKFKCRKVVGGEAEGKALVVEVTISFWGGVDTRTGELLEKEAAEQGRSVTGRILVFPTMKGSSAGSSCLEKMCELGTGPKAIINTKMDSNIALGAALAKIPMVLIDDKTMRKIQTGDHVKVSANEGIVEVTKQKHKK